MQCRRVPKPNIVRSAALRQEARAATSDLIRSDPTTRADQTAAMIRRDPTGHSIA
jgi:hypothetical protein